MSEIEIETSLRRILGSKNWSSIVLRNDIRLELVKAASTSGSKLDERRIVEYLHQIDDQQLDDLRLRVFKLAKDRYFEALLNQHAINRPFLKDKLLSLTPLTSSSCETSRFEAMRDIVECLEYIVDLRECLPERCIELRSKLVDGFPLGRRHLVGQFNAIKTLRVKILKLQGELENFKRLTNGMEKIESSLQATCGRLRLAQRQNQFLKSLLTLLLIIFITCSFSFFFFNNCINNKKSS